MKGGFYFKIPNDLVIRMKTVQVIRPEWGSIGGCLYAPTEPFVAEEKVARDTGYMIVDSYRFSPIIVGRSLAHHRNERMQPDYRAIMVERKLPGFVEFHHVSESHTEVSIVALAKCIAENYLSKGYLGFLSFYQHSRGKWYWDLWSNPADCRMVFEPLSSHVKSHVEIEWKEEYDGKEEDVTPIRQEFLSLGLCEYIPKGY